MAAAVLGSTGSALFAGSAQAATGCGVQISWAAWVGGQALTCNDKTFTFGSVTTLGDLASSLVSALELAPEDHLFNLDLPGFSSIPFDFSYVASITDPSRVFSAVDLDSDSNAFANPPSVLTSTTTFAGGNSPIVLTSTNGSSAVQSIVGAAPTSMTVQNQYNGAGAIDTMENSFQQSPVPGPLPILGAGVAFGFTRRLRRRIHGATARA